MAILVCCGNSPADIHPSSDYPELDSVIELGWRCLGQSSPPPTVLVLSGTALTCGLGPTGNQGWYATIISGNTCVSGLTVSPSLCYVAYWDRPWHEEPLEHELLHAAQYRVGIIDNNHLGPEWQPGGILETCNQELVDAGY